VDRVAKIFGGGLVLALLSQVIFVWWLGDSDMYLKSADAGNLGNLFFTSNAILRFLISFTWLLTIIATAKLVFGGLEGLRSSIFPILDINSIQNELKSLTSHPIHVLFLLLSVFAIFPINLFSSTVEPADRGQRVFVYTMILYGYMVYSNLKSSVKVNL
jgi:hypothetical protein